MEYMKTVEEYLKEKKHYAWNETPQLRLPISFRFGCYRTGAKGRFQRRSILPENKAVGVDGRWGGRNDIGEHSIQQLLYYWRGGRYDIFDNQHSTTHREICHHWRSQSSSSGWLWEKSDGVYNKWMIWKKKRLRQNQSFVSAVKKNATKFLNVNAVVLWYATNAKQCIISLPRLTITVVSHARNLITLTNKNSHENKNNHLNPPPFRRNLVRSELVHEFYGCQGLRVFSK